jgi:polyisoprenoid-binding protein YceI
MSKMKLMLSGACALAVVVMTGCTEKPPPTATRVTAKDVTKAPAQTPATTTPAPTPEAAAENAPEGADLAPPAATPPPPTGEAAPEPSVPPTPENPNVGAIPDPAAAPMVDGQHAAIDPAAAQAPVTPAGATTGKTYAITPNDDSTIGFIGYKKIGGKREGYFANFDGTVTLPTGAIEGGQVVVNIDLSQMATTARGLSETLQGPEYFNIAEFPKATFTSTNIAKTDAGYDVTGHFEFHGITKEITFPAIIEMKGDKLHAATVGDGFVVNRHDWGISATGVKPSGEGDTTLHSVTDDIILDDVLIKFDVLAEPSK